MSDTHGNKNEGSPGAENTEEGAASRPVTAPAVTEGRVRQRNVAEERAAHRRRCVRSESFESALTDRSVAAQSNLSTPRGVTRRKSDKTVRFCDSERVRDWYARSRRDQFLLASGSTPGSRVDSLQTEPLSYESTSSRRSSDFDTVGSSDESRLDDLETIRSDLLLENSQTESSRIDEDEPPESSSQAMGYRADNIYQEQVRLKVEKGYLAADEVSTPDRVPEAGMFQSQLPGDYLYGQRQRPSTSAARDVAYDPHVHGHSSRMVVEPRRRTYEEYVASGGIPRHYQMPRTQSDMPSRPVSTLTSIPGTSSMSRERTRISPVPPLQLRTTSTERRRDDGWFTGSAAASAGHRIRPQTPPEYSNHNLDFREILRAIPEEITIVTQRIKRRVTVFVLVPNPLETAYLIAYRLDGNTMKPLSNLSSKPPHNTHTLAALVRELKAFLPLEKSTHPLAEWSMVDKRMVMASIEVFERNPEIPPQALFTVISEQLFTDVTTMKKFFGEHYPSYREQQLALARQRLDRGSLQSGGQQLERAMAGITVGGSLTQEEIESQEKQRRYIQTLMPPIRIAPLPPRPIYPSEPRTPPPEPSVSRRPPSIAELASLQACYARDGRPRIKSKPRGSEDQEEDQTEQ